MHAHESTLINYNAESGGFNNPLFLHLNRIIYCIVIIIFISDQK